MSERLNVEISGTNYELTDREQNYIDKKCRKLTNHMSSHSKKSAFVSVKMTKLDAKHGDHYQCSAVLNLPDKVLKAEEAAPTYAEAIDEVERKLQDQIRRYKTARRNDSTNKGGFVAMLKRSLRRK